MDYVRYYLLYLPTISILSFVISLFLRTYNSDGISVGLPSLRRLLKKNIILFLTLSAIFPVLFQYLDLGYICSISIICFSALLLEDFLKVRISFNSGTAGKLLDAFFLALLPLLILSPKVIASINSVDFYDYDLKRCLEQCYFLRPSIIHILYSFIYVPIVCAFSAVNFFVFGNEFLSLGLAYKIVAVLQVLQIAVSSILLCEIFKILNVNSFIAYVSSLIYIFLGAIVIASFIPETYIPSSFLLIAYTYFYLKRKDAWILLWILSFFMNPVCVLPGVAYFLFYGKGILQKAVSYVSSQKCVYAYALPAILFALVLLYSMAHILRAYIDFSLLDNICNYSSCFFEYQLFAQFFMPDVSVMEKSQSVSLIIQEVTKNSVYLLVPIAAFMAVGVAALKNNALKYGFLLLLLCEYVLHIALAYQPTTGVLYSNLYVFPAFVFFIVGVCFVFGKINLTLTKAIMAGLLVLLFSYEFYKLFELREILASLSAR